MITESELLDAIRADHKAFNNPEGFAFRDLKKRYPTIPEGKLRKGITALLESGRLESVLVRRPVAGGIRTTLVIGYRLTTKKARKR